MSTWVVKLQKNETVEFEANDVLVIDGVMRFTDNAGKIVAVFPTPSVASAVVKVAS